MILDLDEMEKRISNKTKLIFLCNPNNPISNLLPADHLVDFCSTVSDKVTLFSDEAYYDYIEEKITPQWCFSQKRVKTLLFQKHFQKFMD